MDLAVRGPPVVVGEVECVVGGSEMRDGACGASAVGDEGGLSPEEVVVVGD